MVSLQKSSANFADASSATGCCPPGVLAMQVGDTHALGRPNPRPPPKKPSPRKTNSPGQELITVPTAHFRYCGDYHGIKPMNSRRCSWNVSLGGELISVSARSQANSGTRGGWGRFKTQAPKIKQRWKSREDEKSRCIWPSANRRQWVPPTSKKKVCFQAFKLL